MHAVSQAVLGLGRRWDTVAAADGSLVLNAHDTRRLGAEEEASVGGIEGLVQLPADEGGPSALVEDVPSTEWEGDGRSRHSSALRELDAVVLGHG